MFSPFYKKCLSIFKYISLLHFIDRSRHLKKTVTNYTFTLHDQPSDIYQHVKKKRKKSGHVNFPLLWKVTITNYEVLKPAIYYSENIIHPLKNGKIGNTIKLCCRYFAQILFPYIFQSFHKVNVLIKCMCTLPQVCCENNFPGKSYQ